MGRQSVNQLVVHVKDELVVQVWKKHKPNEVHAQRGQKDVVAQRKERQQREKQDQKLDVVAHVLLDKHLHLVLQLQTHFVWLPSRPKREISSTRDVWAACRALAVFSSWRTRRFWHGFSPFSSFSCSGIGFLASFRPVLERALHPCRFNRCPRVFCCELFGWL